MGGSWELQANVSNSQLLPLDSQTEVCPNCGRITTSLNDFTGWCDSCTPVNSHVIPPAKFEAFLKSNADQIEYLLCQGFTFSQAVKKIAAPSNRPRCIVCGRSIYRGRPNSIFCRQNTLCRHFSRRYVHLYTSKSLTKSEALSQIMQELG